MTPTHTILARTLLIGVLALCLLVACEKLSPASTDDELELDQTEISEDAPSDDIADAGDTAGDSDTCTGINLTPCAGDCVDTLSDADHCGACDQACAQNQLCLDGRCGCEPGDFDCNGARRVATSAGRVRSGSHTSLSRAGPLFRLTATSMSDATVAKACPGPRDIDARRSM